MFSRPMPWARALLCLAALAAMLSPGARADEPAAALTLERCLALAMEQNPALPMAETRVQAWRGALTQAGAGPNPRLALGGDLDSAGRLANLGVSVSQTFELGGKKQARMNVAGLGLEAAGRMQGEALRLLRLEVKQAFARALAARRLEDLHREGAESARRQLEVGRTRLEMGDLPGVEVARLEVERARREAGLARAAGERRVATQALARLLGEPPTDDLPLQGTLGRPSPVPPLADLQQAALRERPDLQAAGLRTRAGHGEVGLQEAHGVSDLTVKTGLAYQRLVVDGSSFQPPGAVSALDDSDLVVSLQFEAPLPLFDTNEGNIERARALAEEARLEEGRLLREVEAEVAQAHGRLEALREARRTLDEEALPPACRALEVVEEAFSLGVYTLTDLLQARDAWLQAATDAVEAALAEDLAWSALEAAVGADLPEEPQP